VPSDAALTVTPAHGPQTRPRCTRPSQCATRHHRLLLTDSRPGSCSGGAFESRRRRRRRVTCPSYRWGMRRRVRIEPSTATGANSNHFQKNVPYDHSNRGRQRRGLPARDRPVAARPARPGTHCVNHSTVPPASRQPACPAHGAPIDMLALHGTTSQLRGARVTVAGMVHPTSSPRVRRPPNPSSCLEPFHPEPRLGATGAPQMACNLTCKAQDVSPQPGSHDWLYSTST
jgi:hypothetical protein